MGTTEERRTVSTQETITQTILYARVLYGTNDNQEHSAPLGYHTASLGNLYPTFRENVLASTSRAEIPYFLDILTLGNEANVLKRKSGTDYPVTQRHMTEKFEFLATILQNCQNPQKLLL